MKDMMVSIKICELYRKKKKKEIKRSKSMHAKCNEVNKWISKWGTI